MLSSYIADVGDGLAIGMFTVGYDRIQIDCGSDQGGQIAFEKGLMTVRPSVFVLSHFHVDHYNGLFADDQALQHYPPTSIRHVYFPRIPDFPQAREFVQDLLAMNLRLMGGIPERMDVDILNAIWRLNHGSFAWRAVAQGDTMNVDGSEFHVLWPPRQFDDGEYVLKGVRRALEDFEIAKREDEYLRRAYDTAGQSEIVWRYAGDSSSGSYGPKEDGFDSADRKGNRHIERPPLAPATRRANESLRQAANHLSLVFHEDNRFLFGGDIETHEIMSVVEMLRDQNRTRFLTFVAPHHGTHWHDSLLHIRAHWVISSAGPRRFRNLKSNFKSVCNEHLCTYLSGDIHLPICTSPRYRLQCDFCHPRFW